MDVGGGDLEVERIRTMLLDAQERSAVDLQTEGLLVERTLAQELERLARRSGAPLFSRDRRREFEFALLVEQPQVSLADVHATHDGQLARLAACGRRCGSKFPVGTSRAVCVEIEIRF